VKGALGGIAAGIAAGLGISAMKSAFDAYAEGAAKLGDLAAKAGTTVQIMGGLAPVAKLSGTSMDDVATAMAKLAKSSVERPTTRIRARRGASARWGCPPATRTAT
jgi:hypothetical protein